ncbi:MAG: cell division protein ZapE [Bacteroidia bacterium]|nr:cell division protein ZapE [Bacteroidia bacterium]MDW8346002.1 cell division protein ZapE [Bacteroidia bacterium]
MFDVPERFKHCRLDNYIISDSFISQKEAIEQAYQILDYLRRYYKKNLLQKLFRRKHNIKGIYLVGPVGVGKTHILCSFINMLEDIRCAYLHSSTLFMAYLHRPDEYAKKLAKYYDVVCIDEIELDDPGNAARFMRILHLLNNLGVFLICTSNVDPESFIESGYQDEKFYKFISNEFREQYKVIFINGEDYRIKLAKRGAFYIGEKKHTQRLLTEKLNQYKAKKQFTFTQLIYYLTETDRREVKKMLTQYEAISIEDVQITSSADALRLLNFLDDIYQSNHLIDLYVTAKQDFKEWYTKQNIGYDDYQERIALKFERTISRIKGLCEANYITTELNTTQ